MITSIGGEHRLALGAFTLISSVWASKAIFCDMNNNNNNDDDENIDIHHNIHQQVNDFLLIFIENELPSIAMLMPKRRMLDELYFNYKTSAFEPWNSKMHLGIDKYGIAKYQYKSRKLEYLKKKASMKYNFTSPLDAKKTAEEINANRLLRLNENNEKFIYHHNTHYKTEWLDILYDVRTVGTSFIIGKCMEEGIPVILLSSTSHNNDKQKHLNTLNACWNIALHSKGIVDKHHATALYTLNNTIDGKQFDTFLKNEMALHGHGVYAPILGKQLNVVIEDVGMDCFHDVVDSNSYMMKGGNLKELLRNRLESKVMEHGIDHANTEEIRNVLCIL